jgi:hypothetical protein
MLVEYWVDAHGRIVQIDTGLPFPIPGEPALVGDLTMKFSSFGTPVVIQRPASTTVMSYATFQHEYANSPYSKPGLAA